MRYIDSSDCRRIDRVSEDIIRAFEPGNQKFKVGGRGVGITKHDVKLILGIVDGHRPVMEPRQGKNKAWRFCARMFVGCDQLTQKLIKEKLNIVFERAGDDGHAGEDERPGDVEDVVRLLCLLAFGSFFFPRNSVRLPWGWVRYVERLEEMRSFDWSGRILSLLVESLVSEHSTPYSVKGCTLLPFYWLCEHAKVIPVREDLGDAVEMILRLVKWHLPKMKDLLLVNIVGDEVDLNDLVPTKSEVVWYKQMKKWAGIPVDNMEVDGDEDDEGIGRTSVDLEDVDQGMSSDDDFVVTAKKRKVVGGGDYNDAPDCVSLSDDDEVRGVGVSLGKKSLKVLENELLCVKKKYADLLKEHDDVRLKFAEIEEEKNALKSRVVILEASVAVTHATPLAFSVPTVDGVNMPYEELLKRWTAGKDDIKKKNEEIWKLTEKLSSVSATIAELRGEYYMKTAELQKANAMIAEFQKKMTTPMTQRPIDMDERRWYSEIVEPIVHSVTQEYCPHVEVPIATKNSDPNSMIKRIKKKPRKQNKDDDFVYVNLNGKRAAGEGSSLHVDSQDITPDGFLGMLDKKKEYNGHFGHYMKVECVAAFVSIYNRGVGATVYHTDNPLVVVTVGQVLEMFRGVFVCNSVIDAYAAHLLKEYKGKRNITIVSADCWTRIVNDDSQELLEQIRQASLLENALVLFPVLSSGGIGNFGQNHWTLMVYDVHGAEWTFYNSKRPRKRTIKDKYQDDAEKMKALIEDYLDVGPGSQFDPETRDCHLPLEPVAGVPSQGSTSDCAIFTCYFMKHVVRELELEKKMNTELVKKFKAEIVEALLSLR